MPVVWRISKKDHIDFDGEGVRRYGGRWNRAGTAVVYASENLSLAALEYFVNLAADLLPDDLVAIPATLPQRLKSRDIGADELPDNWRDNPAPETLKGQGTEWVRSGVSALLWVPSAVIPEERNVLLDPNHPDFKKIAIGSPRPFSFDPRMLK